MKCNIGLVSEFEDKYPNATIKNCKISTEIYPLTIGASNFEEDEAWVFIDRVMHLKRHSKYIIPMITRVLVHEIIHLYGYDEKIAQSGEELVMQKW